MARRALLLMLAGADVKFLTRMAKAGRGRFYKTTGARLSAVCRIELRRLGR